MVKSAVKVIPGGTAPGGNMASAGMAISMGGSLGMVLARAGEVGAADAARLLALCCSLRVGAARADGRVASSAVSVERTVRGTSV